MNRRLATLPSTTAALLELSSVFLFWVTAVWGAGLPGGFYWQAASVVGMILVVVFSLAVRRPGWVKSGFRLDNFASSLAGVGLSLLLLLLILTVVVKFTGLSFQPVSQKRILNTIIRGVFQEAFFLGILFNRWNDLLRNPRAAVLANAVSFSLVHLPDPFFVLLTCAGGVFFGALFLKFRNVWVIGLAHGVLGLFIASAFHTEGFLTSMKIGPPQLASFVRIVSREWTSESRFAMGSHDLVAEQFGKTPFLIEKVSGAFDIENDETNRELLKTFLAGENRVFCAIIENDFFRYVGPELRDHLFILGDQKIWKRRIQIDREFWVEFFYGNKDLPVLGVFRDRVLLVSNKAPGRKNTKSSESTMSRLEEQIEQNAKLGIKAVPFPEGLDWFNVSRSLQISELKGKVVLLDFWTYCCINCMHVIPELKRLEALYPNELAVIGVHSAKFSNEKDSENIRQSILRYEVRHPVINDFNFILWQSYGVHAWPTLVLIDPEGHVVLTISGEGHFELLNQAVQFLIHRAQAKGILNQNPLPLSYEGDRAPKSLLAFPGKIFADESQIVISDSNHNQILIADGSGRILETIGRGSAGKRDGDFQTAEFDHPQGVFRDGDELYVADTENHLIRYVDLRKKKVETIAGTGKPGAFIHGKLPALQTSLNSPWDLVKIRGILYIAMAGAHQIWSLDLKQGELDLFAGSGREDIMDGKASTAALAQPSGIAFDGKDTLYFADSEVSAVRSIHLPSREVRTLIGKGLFDFGDKDGVWEQALLQHPLGVSYADGVVFVADTYNDKIKAIDLKKGTVSVIAGTGKKEVLYEPGGISVTGRKLYIADTNNHSIRVLDLQTQQLTVFQLSASAPKEGATQNNPFLENITLPSAEVAQKAKLSLAVELPENHEFTEGTPLHFKVMLTGSGKTILLLKEDEFEHPERKLPIQLDFSAAVIADGSEAAGVDENGVKGGQAVLEVELDIPYCTTVEPKLCKFKSIKWTQNVSFSEGGKDKLEFRAKI